MLTEQIDTTELLYNKKYNRDNTLESVSDIETKHSLKDLRSYIAINRPGYILCTLSNMSKCDELMNLDSDSTTYIERYVVKRHREYVMSLSEYKDAKDSCKDMEQVSLINMQGLYLNDRDVSPYRRQGRKFYIRDLSFSESVFNHEGRYIIEEDDTNYE